MCGGQKATITRVGGMPIAPRIARWSRRAVIDWMTGAAVVAFGVSAVAIWQHRKSALHWFRPRDRRPSPPAATELQNAAPRILVVEDDANLRRTCVETLRDLQFDVLDAPDAMEALRLIADHGGIDVLVTEIRLPNGVSGRALADAARNVDPEMKVVFSTIYPADEVGADGALALLLKPFTQAQFASKVREMIDAGARASRGETVLG
jgi:CheY-like chemotaxis protein